MPLNRESKIEVVKQVSEQLSNAQTLVIAEYRGVQVGDMTTLRANARQQRVYLRVLKNNLARLAVKGSPFEALSDQMTGPLVYSISDDAVAAAKVLHDFSLTNDKLIPRSGICSGKLIDASGVKQLASIPSREVLLARLVAVMQSPLSKFAQLIAALSKSKVEEDSQAVPAESSAA